jgi:hypothetical protein
MNLARANVVLRPRTVGEVLDLACMVCVSGTLGLYARLAAWVLLPGYAGCLALRYALGWHWSLVWLTAIAVGMLVQGVFTVAAGRFLFAESLTVREVLAAFRRRFAAYLGTLLISRFFLAASLFFPFVLPFAWMRSLFVHEASLLEMAGAGAAVKRASRFVQGDGARAFQMLLVLFLAQIGFVVVAEFLGDGVVDTVLQLGDPFESLWQDFISAYSLLGFFASIPFIATARFLLYIDRRTRIDGWDIQLRFMAITANEQPGRLAA